MSTGAARTSAPAISPKRQRVDRLTRSTPLPREWDVGECDGWRSTPVDKKGNSRMRQPLSRPNFLNPGSCPVLPSFPRIGPKGEGRVWPRSFQRVSKTRGYRRWVAAETAAEASANQPVYTFICSIWLPQYSPEIETVLTIAVRL